MGKLLILLALGFAAADELDRIYLPPPDAQYSGGNPEELQVPLEFPKEAPEITSIIPIVTPDNGLIRSGYYIGSILGPNVRKNVDVDQNYDNFLITSPTLNTSTGLSQKPGFNNQYFAAYGQSKYTEPKKIIELRKYLDQNPKRTILDPKTTNTNNQVTYKYGQNNSLFYGQEIIVNKPDYTEKNLMPIMNNYPSNGNVRPGQYAPNAKIMDNYSDSEINQEQNKPNSTVPKSNLKPKSGNVDLRFSVFSKTITPLTSNTRITASRIKNHSRRLQAELDTSAVTLDYHNVITPDGYSYSYDTSNGISANESGIANNGVTAQGAYSYTGDDGKVYRVVYTADENGFQPRGEHLPLLPVAIQRLIEKAAKEQEAGITDDGSYDEKKYGHKKYQGVMDRYNPEFQGFTNNRRNEFGGYSRKLFKSKSTGTLIATIPKTSRKEYNINKQKKNQDKSDISTQDNRVTGPSSDGNERYKSSDMSFPEFEVSLKFIGKARDTKIRPVFLDESQNRENLVKEDVTQKSLQVFPIQQGNTSQTRPNNFVKTPVEYRHKQTSGLNKNIPEIIANSNTYTENEQGILSNKQDGYFYDKPQNKFIENANKEKVAVNTDHELEIGDDDIITVSVPVPSTTIRPDDESSNTEQNGKVTSPNVVNTFQNVKPELSVIPMYTVYSLTPLSSDVNIQTNQPSFDSKAEFGTNINSVRVGSNIEQNYNNFQEPHTQIVQDFKTGPKTLEGGYETLIDGSTSRGIYGQNQNTKIPKTLDIAYTRNLAKGDDSNESKGGDIQSDYSGPLKENMQFDRILEPISNRIIGEDFSGPPRPQSFDFKSGYYN